MSKSFTDVGMTASFSSISYTVNEALPPPLRLDKMPCGCIVAQPNTSAGHVCPAHPQLSLPFMKL